MGTYYTKEYRTRAGTKRDKVRLYLLGHANATVNDVVEETGVSKSYAAKIHREYKFDTKYGFEERFGNPKSQLDSLTIFKDDMVNQPKHYSGSIECIDAMISAFSLQRVKEYSEIAAFKYLWRQGKKGDPAEDKAKAIWYTRFSLGDDPRVNK
jgi:hypothetical protein